MSVVNFGMKSYVDQRAPLVELVDTQDSKSCSGDRVRVRFSRGAPFIILLYSRFKKGKKSRVYEGYRTRLLNSKSRSRKGVPVRFWRGAPSYVSLKLVKDECRCINTEVSVPWYRPNRLFELSFIQYQQ